MGSDLALWQWLLLNALAIKTGFLVAGFVLHALVSWFVAITPMKSDDRWYRRVMHRFSLLKPPNATGGKLGGPFSLPGELHDLDE